MSPTHRNMLPLYLSICLLPGIAAASSPSAFFTSPEHVMIGNKVKLHLSSQDPQPILLKLPNGITATYGEIVTMPDFYGNPDNAISEGRTDKESRDIFFDGYNAFASDVNNVDEATKILGAIQAEQKVVEEGIRRGEKPEVIYQKLGHEFDRQYNCITGGGCTIDAWWLEPGRYLNLINGNANFDHFGENALTAYQVGHQLALEQAAAAHAKHDEKMLASAYAINAFACHFLTDRFASGHIRTPRAELSEETIPVTVGSLLAGYMHNEENQAGLHVHNNRGDHWVAYGDKAYYKPESKTHLQILEEAMQYSADAVYEAFLKGSTQVEDKALDLVPQADEIGNHSKVDISPLFYFDVEELAMMRREDTTNYYDRNWTSDWWGWSTLLKLRNERGMLTENAQAVLARSELRHKALDSGLITNKTFIEYIKKH